MINKKIVLLITFILLTSLLGGCSNNKQVNIGVSIGAGPAVRWDKEKQYMEDKAEALGVNIDVRLNRNEEQKSQQEDCFELIDSGIDALILMPRAVAEVGEILEYAEEKNVPVISYARVAEGTGVDLFVGYDCVRMGQKMGQYLSEMIYEGDYILIKGDEADSNAMQLYDGAMVYIEPLRDDINIILDVVITKWSPEETKEVVQEAVIANGNKVDAILAPNDKLAGACVEALKEIGVETPVSITGMDAELDAVQRIIEGTQDMTIYMDLNELASIAVEEAVHMARGEKVNINAEFSISDEKPLNANLITGQVVTKDNLDRVLIDSGFYTREEIYGE